MCKYWLILFKYVECEYIVRKTVWDECEEAQKRDKRCDGEMVFKFDDNELPVFGNSSIKG